ncbi:MAG: retroviral-like aspartic protease family protein [Rickettsiales bacterium]|jgi:clan AA aspartic protease (TIGR02281 family)|nr:retroviral-like aspartic protease family protein [Rickettsiales bacterium]
MKIKLILLLSVYCSVAYAGRKVTVIPSTMTIKAREYGHYYADVKLMGGMYNKYKTKYYHKFLIDTGASFNFMSYEIATDLFGKNIVDGTDFNTPISTGNGVVYYSDPHYVDIIIGDFKTYRIKTLIAPKGALKDGVLGMSFLSSLKEWSVKDDVLTIKYNKYKY